MIVQLHHFVPAEFRGWFDQVAPRLLVLLDVLRGHWRAPIRISPARGAIGRRLGPQDTSQHNIDRWGEVRAVDVMPFGMSSPDQARRLLALAEATGFTGLGVYPHWQPRPGLHVDVRIDVPVGSPAQWGAIDEDGKQVYVSVDTALGRWRQ